MTSCKLRSFLSVFVAAAGLALLGAVPSYAGAPAAGAWNSTNGAPGHKPAALSGIPFPNGNDDVGWVVFSATGSGAVRVVDPAGNAPTCGLVRSIVLSTGAVTEYAVLYDTAPSNGGANLTAANTTPNLAYSMAPTLIRSTSTATNQVLFAQFNYGLWLVQTQADSSETAFVYWRPCASGAGTN